MGARGPRDVDSAARGRLLSAVAWGSAPGMVLGILAGVMLHVEHGWNPALALLLGAAVGGTVTVGSGLLLSEWAGRMGGLVYWARSDPTSPRRREYSYAASLAARGRSEEAVAAYEGAILDDPTDLEPYLRIADLMVRDLGRPEEGIQWLRRARSELALTRPLDAGVSTRIVELLLGPLADPARAMPELARLAELHRDTEAGQWAQRELSVQKAARFGPERGEEPAGGSPPAARPIPPAPRPARPDA